VLASMVNEDTAFSPLVARDFAWCSNLSIKKYTKPFHGDGSRLSVVTTESNRGRGIISFAEVVHDFPLQGARE